MIKRLRKIQKKAKSDGGAMVVVEFLIWFVLFIFLLCTVIDYGLYFHNRNVISNAAQNGARIAAVYGGTASTGLRKKYGVIKGDKAIETAVANEIEASGLSTTNDISDEKGTVRGTHIQSIECGPTSTRGIGDRTWCTVKWRYRNVPGSLNGLLGLLQKNTTTFSAESEVVNQ